MKYNYNGWFDVEGDSKEDAEKQLRSKLLGAMDSIDGIDVVKELKGAWKEYNFKGWFVVNARSPVEALKRAKQRISKESGVLVSENEVASVDAPIEEMEVDTSYLTEKDTNGKLLHFVMSNNDKTQSKECHAATAADAWEYLRGHFIYDEHVILFQHVAIPCAVSPRWRAFDIARGVEKAPSSLGHQLVIALGFAGEEWWGKKSDIIRLDDSGMVASATEVKNFFSD